MDETVATSAAGGESVYPMPAPPGDGRFTHGLIGDVADVLVKHGYAPVTSGGDLGGLMMALHGFLYRPTAFGNDPTTEPQLEYGHDRIEYVNEPLPVPAGVDGESMTGRPVSVDVDQAHAEAIQLVEVLLERAAAFVDDSDRPQDQRFAGVGNLMRAAREHFLAERYGRAFRSARAAENMFALKSSQAVERAHAEASAEDSERSAPGECLGRDMDCGRPTPCPDHPAPGAPAVGEYDGVPLCEHGDDAMACQLKHRPVSVAPAGFPFPVDQPDPAEIAEEIEQFARDSARLREAEEHDQMQARPSCSPKCRAQWPAEDGMPVVHLADCPVAVAQSGGE